MSQDDVVAAPVEIVRFYVPESSAEPIDVKVEHSGLRMVLVNRESIRLLGESWRVLGIYFLLGASDDPDRYRAYVGEVGRASLVHRLKQHALKKDWWSRALLITSDEFHSAEIGWLEGRLYDVLNNAVACDVMNGNRPGDDSLAARERGVLEKYVGPIMAALRACGAPPDTADQKPAPKGRRPRRYSETVSDLIAAGLLKPGTQLQPLRKGLTVTAVVRPDGQLEIGGEVHASLSGAAKAAAGTGAEAGWDFWGAPSGRGGFVPLAELRARLREERSNGGSRAVAAVEPVSEPAPAKQPADTKTARRKKAPRRFAGTVAELIERGLLEPGVVLRPSRHSLVDQTAIVNADGSITVGDHTYASPSAAAKATSGGKAEPGWDFWLIDDDRGGTLASRRAALQ